MSKKINKKDLYYIAFVIYLTATFLKTTMFNIYIPEKVFSVLIYLSLIIVMLKIMLEKYSKKKIIVLLIIIAWIFLAIIKNSYLGLLYLTIFVIGAKNCSIYKITKIYFIISISIMTITIISSQIGIIENLIYYRGEIKRQSFGIVYPTDFAAHVFYIILAYIYLRKGNMRFFEYIVLIFIAYFIYKYCDARLDTISIIIMLIFCFIYQKFGDKIGKNLIFKVFLISSFAIFSGMIIFLTINYNQSEKIYYNINYTLSNRLLLGNNIIKENGISLFGKRIQMNGWGGTTIHKENYVYNYIDSSYIQILVLYGIIIYCIFLLAHTYFEYRAIKNNNLLLAIILMVIAINSIVAQHYIEIAYNFFIIMYIADIQVDERKVKKIESRNNNSHI